jgi:hypothetical protein
MTKRERRLMKIVMGPMLGTLPLPTFDEWCAAVDELFPA